MRWHQWIDDVWRDARYAVRGIVIDRGFAVAVILTLGLGLGANAAMFGVVDRLLFRAPSRLIEPETAHRVHFLRWVNGKETAQEYAAYARFLDLKRATSSFARLAAHGAGVMPVGAGEDTRRLQVASVSASFFGFFDAPPVLGRYFTDGEDQPPAGTPVAVLGYALWQTQYGGRHDVLGASLPIGELTYTIVGVAPADFVGLWPDRPPAAYIPITSYAAVVSGQRSGWWQTYRISLAQLIARRKPGVTMTAANADLSAAYLASYRAQREEQPGISHDSVVRPRAIAGSILAERGPSASSVSRVAIWVAGMSLIVLLVATANVANLLLARALRRRREIAVRLALGVSRRRLAAQLLMESALLGVFGGVAGLAVAHWAGAIIRGTLLSGSEAPAGLHDPRTVAFAGSMALLVGLVTGLAPVLQSRRVDLTSDLKTGAREGGPVRTRLRVALLVAQGALSVLLLVGAGLFVRSLHNVRSLRLGYDIDPVLFVSINRRGERLDSAQAVALRQRLQEAARSVTGVEQASLQLTVPFWSAWEERLFVAGVDSVNSLGSFSLNAVSPEHFATVGTRLLRGRGIEASDRDAAPPVMVVSQEMGRLLWPGEDPIGQCIRVRADTVPCTTVVGIAEDITPRELGAASSLSYYVPAAQFNPTVGGLFVRTRGEAVRLAEAVRQRLQREMPGAAYVTVAPFRTIIADQTRSWELGASMFTAFGILALILAAVGLYGVVAYNVGQRTRELGVRMALGARASDVVRLIIGSGLRVVAVGLVVGVATALWAVQWIAPLLFRVAPRDPLVFGVVTLTLLGVAVAASWLPARRAARVEPSVALRSD